MTACWPLYARIEVAGDTVRVSDFFQPYRKQWNHDGLGLFAFARAEMLREIRALLAAKN